MHDETNPNKANSPPRLTVETDDSRNLGPKYFEWKKEVFDKNCQSPIAELFYGHTIECKTCMNCGKTKYSFSYFSELPLEIST